MYIADEYLCREFRTLVEPNCSGIVCLLPVGACSVNSLFTSLKIDKAFGCVAEFGLIPLSPPFFYPFEVYFNILSRIQYKIDWFSKWVHFKGNLSAK